MTRAAKKSEFVHQRLDSDETHEQVTSKLSIFVMLLVLLISGYVYYFNMFEFPQFQDAEGTNMANAWALQELNDFSPYTYAYEEAPLGTIIIAGWTSVTGGYETFGFPLNSGRILMLFMHVLSVALVYAIAHKITDSIIAALIASLIFAFSPLALSIQRRVLVDNMMLVCMLGAFYLSTGKNQNLYNFFGSGLLFGVAVLIKTSALYFFPAFLYTIALTSYRHHKRFAMTLWTTITLTIIAFYPLYAQMREELFPEGWLFGGDFPHVSLIERLLDRGPVTGLPFNAGSGLAGSFDEWTNISHLSADPIIIFGGAISLLFITVMANDNRSLRPLAAMALAYMVGLFIGGRIFVSDILPLLPFFAISAGVVIALIGSLVGRAGGEFAGPVFMLIAVGVMLYPYWMFYLNSIAIYEIDQTTQQIEAVEWIENTLPEDSVVVTDNYAFVHLRQTMPNTHHYWKVDTDPDVKFNMLEDNYCNIDYLLTTPQVLSDMEQYSMQLLQRSYNNSDRLRRYENNGWPVEIWQVNHQNCVADLSIP